MGTSWKVTPVAGTDHQVEVDWDDVLEASDYDVYVDTATMGADPTVGGTQVGGDTSSPPVTVDVASLISAGADDQVFANVRGTNTGGDGPWGTEGDGYTHVERPTLVANQDVTALPSVWFDLTLGHTNSDGDVRNTSVMTLEREDSVGGWSTITSSLAAGTTAYTDTGASSTTVGYRVKYNGESLWRTITVSPVT